MAREWGAGGADMLPNFYIVGATDTFCFPIHTAVDGQTTAYQRPFKYIVTLTVIATRPIASLNNLTPDCCRMATGHAAPNQGSGYVFCHYLCHCHTLTAGQWQHVCL